jgi:hypothetical protein
MVTRSLDPSTERRSDPGSARVDNRPEYIRGKLMEWAEKRAIVIEKVQPGKPLQSAKTAAPGMRGWTSTSSKPSMDYRTSHARSLDFQQRRPEYVRRWHHAHTETENCGVSFTTSVRSSIEGLP